MTKKVKKPSAAEIHKAEFRREMKHLSSYDLGSRLNDVTAQACRNELEIGELTAKLKELRYRAQFLSLQQDVLHGLLSERG